MQSVARCSIHTFSLSCLHPCQEKERCVARNKALDEREDILLAQAGPCSSLFACDSWFSLLPSSQFPDCEIVPDTTSLRPPVVLLIITITHPSRRHAWQADRLQAATEQIEETRQGLKRQREECK